MDRNEFREMRLTLGLSQQDLAVALGMTVSSVSQMERGVAPILLRTDLALRYLAGQSVAKSVANPRKSAPPLS